jgi:dTDP-4-amino-4,6-dideoxygalactose transaminase
MSIPLVDLSRQYKELKPQIKNAVLGVFEKCNFVLGEQVKKFEDEFAYFCGSKYCIGVGSGRDALLLSLRALNIEEGDEVITVPNTFIATVFPIVEVGAKPVFVDINPDTYQIDIAALERAITKKTRAIIPVHLYGIPCEMDKILKIAKKYKLFVIEDAAQAHGSTYKGKKCGSFGDLGAFSFYPGKNLGAAGEGGAIVTNKKGLADKIRAMRDVGQTQKYIHTYFGYNSRLDTIHAAVLLAKLTRLDAWNAKRRKVAVLYTKLLSDLPVVLPPKLTKDYKCNYHLYVIRTEERDKLMNFLKENGIFCGIHYPIPVHLQKALKKLGYRKKSFPITEKYASEILSLPMFPQMKEQEVREVSRAIHKFFRQDKQARS